MKLSELYEYIDSQERQMVNLWRHLVEIESWSQDVQGVKQLAAHLDTYFSAMGLNTRQYIFENSGPSLVAFNRASDLPSIILMAHMDTVHRPGSFGKELFRRDGDFICGPGAYDCKGGIVIAILTMRALQRFGYDRRQIKIILSGDEEVAHELSNGKGAEVYRQEAEGCALAFNCESGMMNGDVVTQRKGGAIVKIRLHGIAAHSGRNPLDGASAVKEAARMVLAIEELNDYNDTYFNCGKISGGDGANVIPAECELTVGARFSTNAGFDAAIEKLKKICETCSDPRITAEMKVTATFRAMELTPKTDRLFAEYKKACIELGFAEPQALASGGCSDAAYITMEGIPVLCGVGARGRDNHALTERAVASSIREQAKKLVTTIIGLPDDF